MALIHCNFFSDVLGMAVSMDVILPEAPGREPTGKIGYSGGSVDWPCLYLLHGLSDDHTIWQRRTSIERYVAPLGLAVVMPAVHRSFYTDMVHGQRFGTFIGEEVPAMSAALFRISSQRGDSFVAGLSMGGYGAFKLALQRPDRFCAAASLSGALDIAQLVAATPPDDPVAADFGLVFGEGADIRGTDHDLMALAERVAGLPVEQQPRLFQCCGTEDFLYEGNIAFLNHAHALNLPLTYREAPGLHEWGFWDRHIGEVLSWLPIRDR